jgi:hypothetical protein
MHKTRLEIPFGHEVANYAPYAPGRRIIKTKPMSGCRMARRLAIGDAIPVGLF